MVVDPLLADLERQSRGRRWESSAESTCKFLQLLHAKAQTSNEGVANERFYLAPPSKWTDEELVHEYMVWTGLISKDKMRIHVSNHFSLFSFRFLVSAHVKQRMMILEDREVQMQNIIISSLVSNAAPYFEVVVRRDFLLEDTVSCLLRARKIDLRKPLRVRFKGEEGLDAGGVRKEFFQVLSEKLFDPTLGMFLALEGENVEGTMWFNPYR